MSDKTENKMGDLAGENMAGLEDIQHWTWVMGRAQQMLMEHASAMSENMGGQIPEQWTQWGNIEKWPEQWQESWKKLMDNMSNMAAQPFPGQALSGKAATLQPLSPHALSPQAFFQAQQDIFTESMTLWQGFLGQFTPSSDSNDPAASGIPQLRSDRRFKGEQWQNNPFFALMQQSYLMISDHMMKMADQVDGLEPKQKEQFRFAIQNALDAGSPSNFPLTNPEVLEKTIETKGQNLLKGLEHMLNDMRKGQVTHTDPDAFELGRNIATTPGKVVLETPMFQLIQYAPTTETVHKVPLIIFPPWINRFYILDLNEKKSFVRWAVAQGLTVFMVSWKSADSSMADVVMDDYVKAQIEAIDTVRELLNVPHVHTIGYCVAGTTLAATLALLHKRKEADKVKSVTFFTAQVDFEKAGDLQLFVDEEQLKMLEQLSAGYLDGRYMAATFNLLRGRDLIWNYVVNNYLKGEEYPPFDLLHWNGDTTNLPAKWHRAYLKDLYDNNLMVKPNALTVDGTPIDLSLVKTPTFVQAGRQDHIAPPESVWRITEHFSGPVKFLLAGSGHIAGVVNPPEANKYQYWENENKVDTLEDYIEGAKETPGSWWPAWIKWMEEQAKAKVKATGARIPGKGKLKALEDAPGSYVKSR